MSAYNRVPLLALNSVTRICHRSCI